MWLDAIRILGGGLCLYFGAEWLVSGAAGLARAFGMRPIVIGLTVVAFGTSAPELVVSLLAAVEGRSAIALGNVIGSNIANIGLILGITAVISPPNVEGTLARRELPVLCLSALALPLMLSNGVISRVEGSVLVLSAVAFTWFVVRSAVRLPPTDSSSVQVAGAAVEGSATGSKPKLTALTVLGLVVLVVGGKLFVDGASGVAAAFGVSDRVIGLTVVAIGTSLPELAASLVAALKGHSALAVGNVVGSNIYNILLILGASALAQPISAAPRGLLIDFVMLGAMTLLAALFMRSERRIRRAEGLLLGASYVGFLAYVIIAPS